MSNKQHKTCNTEKHETPIKHGKKISMLQDLFCKDHDVVTCKCGWEWGWHGGTYNR